jgi:hypothetical protein
MAERVETPKLGLHPDSLRCTASEAVNGAVVLLAAEPHKLGLTFKTKLKGSPCWRGGMIGSVGWVRYTSNQVQDGSHRDLLGLRSGRVLVAPGRADCYELLLRLLPFGR